MEYKITFELKKIKIPSVNSVNICKDLKMQSTSTISRSSHVKLENINQAPLFLLVVLFVVVKSTPETPLVAISSYEPSEQVCIESSLGYCSIVLNPFELLTLVGSYFLHGTSRFITFFIVKGCLGGEIKDGSSQKKKLAVLKSKGCFKISVELRKR